MDTPGHVDFAYEVSRSLAACEGSLLVVDATQGVEAQTLANVYQAIDADHEIVPVLNKIDLPAAELERVKQQIEDVIGLDASDAIADLRQDRPQHRARCWRPSSHRLPPPKGDAERAAEGAADRQLVRRLSRRRRAGAREGGRAEDRPEGPPDVHRRRHEVERVGFFTPKPEQSGELGPGEIGFLTAGIKDVADTKIGDTITDERQPAPGRCRASSRRCPWCSAACSRSTPPTIQQLRDSLAKLRLNDASFHFEPETSAALGFGFRCGFLGLLHLEIIQERLEREFNLDLITTAPSVVYQSPPDQRRR